MFSVSTRPTLKACTESAPVPEYKPSSRNVIIQHLSKRVRQSVKTLLAASTVSILLSGIALLTAGTVAADSNLDAMSRAIEGTPDKRKAEAPIVEDLPKSERSYFGIFGTRFETRDVTASKDDLKYDGLSLVAGTYLSDNFKLEIRAGTALEDVEVSTDPDNSLDFRINYYVSGLIGPQANLTDYMQVYGLVGVTRLVASTDRSARRGFPDIPEELIDSSFSFAFVLGTDLRVYKELWASFEFGRLHKDTITNIRTEFLNLGLKYEF